MKAALWGVRMMCQTCPTAMAGVSKHRASLFLHGAAQATGTSADRSRSLLHHVSSCHASCRPSALQIGNEGFLACDSGCVTLDTPMVTVHAGSGTGLSAEDGPVLPDASQLLRLCVNLLNPSCSQQAAMQVQFGVGRRALGDGRFLNHQGVPNLKLYRQFILQVTRRRGKCPSGLLGLLYMVLCIYMYYNRDGTYIIKVALWVSLYIKRVSSTSSYT